MELAQAQKMLEELVAPWVRQLDLQVEAVGPDESELRLPFDAALKHGGGVICGQVFMAVADTAMVVALSAALGGFRPMTTVTLNTHFMRPVSEGDLRVIARLLRRGKNLVFGEIEIFDASGKMAVHATTTYALL
ncbi:PaaI family thioesterase [Pandoraea nosoerga]|uniref:Phenylacetic acid degradation protein n=1 Tax=Pandoraea nosoerga TaxID=2508296 RepID=A0A5E4UA51_9BURK|nr:MULTISPECIES: PaaI family thioesterase [Pandoraea]MBN4667450.1 PaaI family thioesterase [Pandoraea nosoerga]MBN4677424.1 PaaI family thioesterase [Pandoraea nosoerga]MBN4682187.1 PaaI family thioesterase [Pandoraea nosoerga]MBN4746544.1 PaaI family thioesterase [Pandoraea nosoerga]VVD96930.1 phenylacetic acid degradation protein [Pandoraea nosoerga]